MYKYKYYTELNFAENTDNGAEKKIFFISRAAAVNTWGVRNILGDIHTGYEARS